MPNFVKISQMVSKNIDCSVFQNGCRPPYWIFKCKNFSGRTCAEVAGISPKLVKQLRTYGDFFILQDDSRPLH